jgi:hypothetical protein
VDVDSPVYSPVDGIIDRIDYQSDYEDYELFIKTGALTGYIVSIDHIKNLTVREDEAVTAGQKLGTAGTWSDKQSRVELMVTKGNISYCPTQFFDPALKTELCKQISNFMSDWEEFKGDTTIYNESAMPDCGCNGLEGSSM